MKKKGRAPSLRTQMLQLILLCWLLPVLMVLAAMAGYFSVERQTEESYTQQFQVNVRLCADRVNSAVEASRLASYDATIREAWTVYQQDGNYAALHREARGFLNRQYQSDSRFLYSVFWFTQDPEEMQLTTVNSSTGTMFNQVSRWWEEDFAAVQELAGTLDTAVGFLEREGRLYLVRNLMDPGYRPIGVLALALNQPYYFEELSSLHWASAVTIRLGGTAPIALRGEELAQTGQGIVSQRAKGSGYDLVVSAAMDYQVLRAPFNAYQYLLLGMGILLIPLLMVTVRFLRRKVSRPVAVLMEGAAEIEQGRLGYRLDYQANSREFQYLTDAFNHMSGQLQHQFNRLYQEELALRDAHIKALQAHINPHFLNNTLEIINWEARMNGDAKVSKMIEALATVLDAALDRHKSPEVRLAEEMTYVNAYLYIVSERFGRRLTVRIDLPEELMDCLVPRLILQPVIENAVEHSVGPGGQGVVTLRGYRQEGFLILEIENDGGLSGQDEALIERLLSPEYDSAKESSGNIGIANVNLRLRILYGPDCGLTISRGEGALVIARLKVALHREKERFAQDACP